ncbi:hypothetical protein FGRA07_02557 [Fusarium graminearum]|nr:hypothetical protein FGRA07_02557 [Fusarium graminearum]
MIYMEAESHYESWSALPLFDRVASPDPAKDFVPDLNDYESPTFEIDLLSETYDFDNFPTYSLPTVDSTKTLYSEEPLVCFDFDFANPAIENYITTSSGLAFSVATQNALSQLKTCKKSAPKALRLARTVLGMSLSTNQQCGALGKTRKDNNV